VKPGITGWAQVNGRDAIPWPQRFELDAWYIEHWSPMLDVKIVARTALELFRERPEPVVDEMNIARAKARQQ
jgi:lipopolysaccharide/colanic/teichoic acid biosynthesis glycosyltransferase